MATAIAIFVAILILAVVVYAVMKVASDNDDMVEKMIHDAFERAKEERRKGGKNEQRYYKTIKRNRGHIRK